MPDPCLLAVSAELPPSRWSTDELLAAADGRLSDRLVTMLAGMGVRTRHSMLANYPEVLFAGVEPKLEMAVSELAARAVRSCLAKAEVDPASIGLVLGVTSSPGRLLPSLVCDLFALLPEIPRDAVALSLEYLGCSAMAKVVDTARWFLTAEPGKRVLVCFLDAITPLSPPLPEKYAHFTEVPNNRRQDTVNVMHGFLFGDASVAMLLGAQGAGPRFGPVAHLTNERPEDTELGTVPDGGSDIPVVHGRRLYTLGQDITARGTHYATSTVRSLLATGTSGLAAPSEASVVLLHTGSNRILDGLCAEFGVDPDGPEVASSYRILREYGNTLGCSVPLMFADPVRREPGVGLVVAFGLSFSCGAFTVRVPDSGWRP
ncbi:MAG TPA: 3-oxoacyl-[acyl-carrier-protein] synthase III C-terminal domain-containing protein [Pseudonocardiaceae bacterium]|jgi:3-oxoacyl-[acyl-carrier-protein] synthase-3|nr:3-oxoacyl-[acyl-carrier-protein] synthase III C-terminal domain-containing protein [Pseudonocardiaceae bacterium]